MGLTKQLLENELITNEDFMNPEIETSEIPTLPILFEKVIAPTKSGADELANMIIAEVTDGIVDPAVLGVKIKWLQDVLEKAYKGITDSIRSQAELYGKEGVKTIAGAKIELAEVGVKYTYSSDVFWSRIKEKIEPLETELKEREDFLKHLSKPQEVIDDESGEVVRVVPPMRESKSSIKITLAK